MRTLRPTLGRGVCPGSTPSNGASHHWVLPIDGAKIDPVLRLGAPCVLGASQSAGSAGDSVGRKGLICQDRPRVLLVDRWTLSSGLRVVNSLTTLCER